MVHTVMAIPASRPLHQQQKSHSVVINTSVAASGESMVTLRTEVTHYKSSDEMADREQ